MITNSVSLRIGLSCLMLAMPTMAQASCKRVAVVFKKQVVVQEVVQAVAVPVAVAVPTYQYYGTGSASPGEVDRIAEAVYQKFIRAQQAQQAQPQQYQQPQQPQSGPPTAEPFPGTARSPATAQALPNFDQARFINVITTKCASCHSGEATAGKGVKLFDTNNQLLPLNALQRYVMWDEVHTAAMPKNGQPLDESEKELFRIYARLGASQPQQ